DILRNVVQLGAGRTVHRGGGRSARQGAAAGLVAGPWTEPAVGDLGAVFARVALLEATGDGDTELLVRAEQGRVDARDFRGDRLAQEAVAAELVVHRQVVVRGVVDSFHADRSGTVRIVERTRGHDVDGGANTARWGVGTARLVHLQLR